MGNEEWAIALTHRPSPIAHRPICLAQSTAIIPRPDEISGLEFVSGSFRFQA
jgi:hypothetical protein